MKTITWLAPGDGGTAFPPVSQALDDPPGLLAAGGDLAPERLLAAYRRGIFPWYSRGQPVLWWCPDPRAVLIPAEFRRSRSLAKSERNGGFEVRFDTVFAAVMEGCAAPRARGGPGTWITPEMRSAYVELHRRGHAHSVETWRDGVLVGGLYGVQIGAAFFGESMFSTASDASKVAFSALVRRCMACGTELIDCQMSSRHLETLGCRSLPRDEFLARLTPLTALGVECRWTPGRPHD